MHNPSLGLHRHGVCLPQAPKLAALKEPLPLQAAMPLTAAPAASIAVLLQEQYWAVESAYIDGLASAFAQLRVARDRQLRHFAGQREAYLAYLGRPAPDNDEKVPGWLSVAYPSQTCGLC